MKIIACGDSWTWGAELVDPIEEPVPIMKLDGGGHDRQNKPINKAYREKNRYIGLLAEKLRATVVDLSSPGISNDTIYRLLLDYLLENDYLGGKDTTDLFISIGWTSPERTEFFYKEKWGGDNFAMFGPWSIDQKYDNEELNDFFNLYYKYFSHPAEYIRRYIIQIYNLEMILKKFNIKYVMHQAFYHHLHETLTTWDDDRYIRTSLDKITKADKKLYDMIDPVRFLNKDQSDGTMHHTIIKLGGKENVFEVWHPNTLGHRLFADYLYSYIIENKLI